MHRIKGLGGVQSNDPDKDSYSVSFIQHEVRFDIHAILLADLLPKLFRRGVEVKNMRLLSLIVGLKSVGGSIAP